MDLFPTVCEVAGLKDLPELDGRSFYKSMLNAGNEHSNRTLFWMRKEGGNYGGGTYYAARKGFYKILQQDPKDSFHYFDLKSDPFEQREILKKDAIFWELEKALKAHQDDISLPGCHPG
jgi:arylsulfatase A-like enzyme